MQKLAKNGHKYYEYTIRLCLTVWEFPDFIKLDGSLDGPSGNLKGTAVSGGVAMSDNVKTALAVVTIIAVEAVLVASAVCIAITAVLWLAFRII